jgi:hypothetical protein
MRYFFLAVAGLFMSTALQGNDSTRYQNTREIITIRWLSKTLVRMGESGIAKRLTDDYYNTKQVHFKFIKSANGNAETGPGLNGKNYISLSELMLTAADLDKLLKERPYGPSSNLIGDAMTVIHEYVHMEVNYLRAKPETVLLF